MTAETKLDLDALKAKALAVEKIHKRQWYLAGRETTGLPHSLIRADTLIARVYSKHFGGTIEETATALFIAAANPQTILELINRLEAAENKVEIAETAEAEMALKLGKKICEADVLAEQLEAAEAKVETWKQRFGRDFDRAEEVEKDAARYRWLRTNKPIHDSAPFIARNFGASFSQWTNEYADAAIDAAMAKEKQS